MPLRDEIADLLRMPEGGVGAPSLDAIESTLTDGYAEVLTIEAERSRIEPPRSSSKTATQPPAKEVSAQTASANVGDDTAAIARTGFVVVAICWAGSHPIPGAYLTQANISRVHGDTMRNLSSANGNRGCWESSGPPSINPTAACNAPSSNCPPRATWPS